MTVSKKHADVIRAWLDGETIEYFDEYKDAWAEIEEPGFAEIVRYRVKPKKISLLQIKSELVLLRAATKPTSQPAITYQEVNKRISDLLDRINCTLNG